MKDRDDPHDRSSSLAELYVKIDQRVFAIVGEQPSWPCQKGCDSCCRHLAQVPELTASEWELLIQGIIDLDQATQAQIAQRIHALATQVPGEIICPLLNETDGACRVYLQRPATCRMHGFYQSRDANWWCNLIQSRYESGEFDDIIFGNQSALNRELHHQFGETKSLLDWFNQAFPTPD